MNTLKRNGIILASLSLCVLQSIHPLTGLAEHLAANTAPASPKAAAVTTATDAGMEASAQLYLLQEETPQELHGTPMRGPMQRDILKEHDAASGFELLPTLANPAAPLIDSYLVDRGDDPLLIKVQKDENTGHAGIFINDTEVMKFRAGYANLDAYDRAHIVAQRLYTRLSEVSGEDADFASIRFRPGADNSQAVIKMGDDVLATVDSESAQAARQSEQRLAAIWTNRIREALGMNPLPLPSPEELVSSPGISKKYNLPMSTAYFASTGRNQVGMASWYGPGFNGRRSSDGSRFDMNKMTAAHRHLPFGTVVKVKNERTGKSCLVQITDRGPFAHGRIIDLSKAAASAIGMLGSGTARVTMEVMAPKKSAPANLAEKQPESRMLGAAKTPSVVVAE